MSHSNENELADSLAASLQSTTSLIQNLLHEIRDNAYTIATMKEKLENVSESVSGLLKTVSTGNGKGSLVTRFAVMEKELEDIEEKLDEHKDYLTKSMEISGNVKEIEGKRSIELLKTVGLIGPGAVACVYLIIQFITGM